MVNTTKLQKRVSELTKDQQAGLPIWIRAPKTGPERWTGFTRAKLYQLDGLGHIRSVSIREPGQIRGVRLFDLRSILAYIERCVQSAQEDATGEIAQTEVTSN
jgi:hypothetical protein